MNFEKKQIRKKNPSPFFIVNEKKHRKEIRNCEFVLWIEQDIGLLPFPQRKKCFVTKMKKIHV